MPQEKPVTLDDLLALAAAVSEAEQDELVAVKEIGQAERRAAKKAQAHRDAKAKLAAAKEAFAKQK